MAAPVNPQDLIESYVREVAAHLPRAQRHDVAAELRQLLTEELRSKADAGGRSPDAAMATELLVAFGRPGEAAARYGDVVTHVIDPSDARAFRFSAVAGIAAIAVLAWLATMREELPEPSFWMALQYWWIRTLLFSVLWLGFLTVSFAIGLWVRRTFPRAAAWTPRIVDPDRANRMGTAIGVPVAAAFVAAYVSPRTVVDWATSGRFNTAWADYSTDFQRGALPILLTAMSAHLILFVWVALKGRWRPSTRRVDLGLSVFITALLVWIIRDGAVFQTPEVDRVVKQGLGLTVLIIVPFVIVQIYREWRRLGDPRALSEANS